ncbi:MAG: KpsF/GutQ family sugar-phosphate isomerase [Chlorobi bacterium]|nr:KpsF/GutQ family sugar-phosphate isomerase [Chlorobiota bacterium]
MTEIGKKVISLEGEAVSALAEKINGDFEKAVNVIFNSKGRVVISGVGKSGLIARKIVATLNSTGTAAISLHPTDALHGDLGMTRKEDVFILISKSGATEELVNLIPPLKRMGVTIIGMLGNRNSLLGKECGIILDVSVTEEACPFDLAPTSSTTAALVMGDALAVTLLKLRGFTENDFAELHPGGSLGKRLSLRISEIMYSNDDVPIVNKETSLKDAIYEISSKRLGVTAVVDGDGVLIGIITDGDIRRLLEKTLDFTGLVAKDFMSPNPKTVEPFYLASFALQKMETYSITSLMVVDEKKKPIGIVHLHDLVKLGLRRR